jgi:hypothetical protein
LDGELKSRMLSQGISELAELPVWNIELASSIDELAA